jgi:hypothetical protein
MGCVEIDMATAARIWIRTRLFNHLLLFQGLDNVVCIWYFFVLLTFKQLVRYAQGDIGTYSSTGSHLPHGTSNQRGKAPSVCPNGLVASSCHIDNASVTFTISFPGPDYILIL